MPDPYIAALGRISGAALAPNLERQGVDLTFRNGPVDSDLLYLDVNNNRIGINTDTPVYDLDVAASIRTNNLEITTQGRIGNIQLNSPQTFSTTVGPIHVYIAGDELWHDRLITSALEFDGNRIGSFTNQNIVLDPNGSGTVQLYANTFITGNLGVTGNVKMNGDLQSAGTVTIGDTIFDTATFIPDFTQSIIPGTDITYDIGKSNKRWAFLYSPTWTDIDNLVPLSITISDQMTLDGVNNKISTIQSNEDILLTPDTGITYIEQTKWQDGDITNLLNSPLTFVSTGIGYTRFMGDNAVVIPSGTTAEQRPSPELGETRWNTELEYLECFDGTVWAVATGGGEEVTNEIMEDLSNVWSLILG
jgi:hypothetical protein